MQPDNPAQPTLQPDPQKPSKDQEDDSDLLEPGEHVGTVVRRHPIGIIGIYLGTLVAIAAFLALIFFIAPDTFDNLSSEDYNLFLGGVILAVVLLSLVLFVATYIYQQSRLLITNRSLVQITQRGLFSRKISRLSMSNIEDVNTNTNGILPTMLNYGTLNVETAGEMENFTFPYCPKPNFYADRIIEARQAYARSVQEENETHP